MGTGLAVQTPYQPGADIRSLIKPSYLETLDGLPFKDYVQHFQGRIKAAKTHRRRDTLRVAAGTTVPKKVFQLFGVPTDADAKTADGGTTYTKDRGDTNMVEPNKLEFGTTLLIESIQVGLFATSRDFNALVAGEPTDLAPAAPATDTVAASNTVIGLSTNIHLDFKIGDFSKVEGLLCEFPSDISFSAAFGGDVQEGFVQMGNGFARPLDQIIILRPQQNFSVALDVLRATTVPQSINVMVMLCGLELGSVGG